MVQISYHISHEQFSPGELLELVRRAEDAGFDAAFSSDHLHPWASAQGESGFIWAWLGAALQATSKLSFGGITVPGNWRYHPAITAHAIATLGQMFPGRLPWVALGSGEAINERVIGKGWPDKDERNSRLEEAASIIRRLLAGERVTTQGGLIECENAQIWSRPEEPTKLVGAAMSEATAKRVGAWADGLLTTARETKDLAKILQAFRSSAGSKPAHLKVDLSWAPTKDEAVEQAHQQWRFMRAGRKASEELSTVEAFEEAARHVTREDMHGQLLISEDPDQHIEWLRERIALGFDTVDLHNVGRNQREFIDVFSRRVLPALRSSR